MKARPVSVFCALLLCSAGVVLSSQRHGYHAGLEAAVALRNLSHHRGGYPLYMMQLYRSFRMADASWSPAVNADAAEGDEPSLHRSDSILSVMARGCHQAGDRWTITFDVSSISTGELVQLAELRIRLPAFSGSEHATVDLYHSGCGEGSASCQDEHLLLGSFDTSPSSSESPWKVFDVTALLKHRLYQGAGLLGQEASGEPDTDSGSGAVGEGETVDGPTSSRRRGVLHPTSNRVMMVVFSRHAALQEGRAAYSLIRASQNSRHVATADRVGVDGQSRRRKRNRVEGMRASDGEPPRAAAPPPPAEPARRPPCRKVDMWVDFDHIGWDEWIVHPKRYNAYRCEGECPTPLDESFRPTNHAYMQSLLRHHHPERVSCPSCVPTRLSPLSMLYFENDDLALRHHEEMIVEECGCR